MVNSNSGSNKPLATFALFAYNQERYIRDAINGAFEQTYSPLEIILSDDCSSDQTFAIMQEMSRTYAGPHKIILNRNEKNLYIGGHVNRVMTLAKGELIVGAAGDDISVPERVSVLVEHFLARGKSLCSIYSDADIIDAEGKGAGLYSVGHPKDYFQPVSYAKHKFHGVLGASHAWNKGLFDVFGPLPAAITYEDDVVPFRAALMGEVIYIPKPLVKYRKHDGSLMKVNNNPREEHRRNQQRHIEVYENNLRELLHYCNFINSNFSGKDQCITEILQNRSISQNAINIIEGNLIEKFIGLLRIVLSGKFQDAGLWASIVFRGFRTTRKPS
jgi:glycosyltransferase involved in cell wall biosynthesis